MVGVVPVHGGGRVTGHEGDRVAYPQRRALGGGEDAVLLVEPDRLQGMAGDGDVFPRGDGLVAGVHDHPVALPADDAGLDGQRVFEPGRHLAVIVVHDHVAAGLDLGDAGEGRGPAPGGDAARRPDRAQDHALAHAGRRHRGHVGPGRVGRAQSVLYARRDGAPARVHVEVLAAGHAGRLVVGPLPLAGPGLRAGLGEQHRPAAAGARVDGQQVASGHRAPWSTCGFTTLAGTRPASRPATAATARSAPRASVSAVAPPMCGVTKTFGRPSSGCRPGPRSSTSSAAPPSAPRASAWYSASSSTRPSRAVLMKQAPGRIRPNRSRANIRPFVAVRRACTEMMSERVSSVSMVTSSTPGSAGGTGSCPSTVKPSARARRATSRPTWPRPTRPRVRLGASRPKNSRPSYTDSAKPPPFSRWRLARGTARMSSRAKAMVSSATASAFLPGVFTTGMPRLVAAATSTLTGLPRAQHTSRSGAAPSTSALTGAPCTTSTSCPATARATCAGSPAYSRSPRSDAVTGGAPSAWSICIVDKSTRPSRVASASVYADTGM